MKQIRLFMLLLLPLLHFSCREKKEEHAAHTEKKEEVYTCPMHPEVVRNAPGSCPICGMDLVKQETEAAAISDVSLDALLRPANVYVIATIPVTTAEERTEEIELDVLGNVTYDTRQVGTISSRVAGRIEKLYVRYKYQRVEKGQKIMELYSPELATAQQNFLFLLKNDPGNTSLLRAAEERLLLLGMSRQQVSGVRASGKPLHSVSVYSNYAGFVTDLAPGSPAPAGMNAAPTGGAQELMIREGAYLQKGSAAFSVYNADKAWILLDLFPEQQALVKKGNPVRIVPEAAPAQNFRARIDYIEPVFRQGSRTLAARVYFNNAALRLPIGSRVRATIFGNTEEGLWLPKEAVLSMGRERLVFVKEGGAFRAKAVTAGAEVNKNIRVLRGISTADSVAVNAQYLVDNEAFIQTK